jgi:2,3-bisphosphoglycerate-dependent phosphoglycerate mutase
LNVPHLRHGFLLGCLLALSMGLGAQDLTVVVVRHAERQSLVDTNSLLSEAGLRRAKNLVPLLESFRPSALYASDLERTQQTLTPMAGRLGLKLLIRPKGGSEALAAEILRDQRGHTVVVCWHHDLMAKLVRALGVKGPVPYLSFDSYDWLWIVHIPAKGEANMEERLQSTPTTGRTSQSRQYFLRGAEPVVLGLFEQGQAAEFRVGEVNAAEGCR